jgi:hypothetical protein
MDECEFWKNSPTWEFVETSRSDAAAIIQLAGLSEPFQRFNNRASANVTSS